MEGPLMFGMDCLSLAACLENMVNLRLFLCTILNSERQRMFVVVARSVQCLPPFM